jgi:uncharacterized membrane protein YdjX (TVP38/TMEM64 family)
MVVPRLAIPMRKVILLILLLMAVAAFYLFGGDRYLSYREVSAHSGQLRHFVETHPLKALGIYMGVYLLTAVLCLPGITLFLTMVGGALFGLVKGVVIAEVSSTLGAFMAFLVARYLLRAVVARQFQGKWEGIKEKLKKHGVRYILTPRFTTAFPYFLLSPLLALTPISPWTFLWTTAVGIFPSTLFYAYLGSRIGVTRVEGVFKFFPIIIMIPLVVLLLASPWLKGKMSQT